MRTRTRDEIDRLKREWLADPGWDIEDTAGFQGHRDELAAFAEARREEWEAARVRRLRDKAEAIGCPGNIALATYIDVMERRIADLEEFCEARLFGTLEDFIELRIDAKAGKYE